MSVGSDHGCKRLDEAVPGMGGKPMSCSKWAYIPAKCDGDVCPGDCDCCSKAKDNVAEMEEEHDEQRSD